MSSLASVVRATLLSSPEITKLPSLRRSTSVFAQNQTADALYFIEEGLIKLTKTNMNGSHMILSICGPGQMVGEESLSDEPRSYYSEAEVLTNTTLARIPRQTMINTLALNSELASTLIAFLVERKFALASKVELLCLHDVEFRILHYLAELSELVKPQQDGEGYQLPITQLELADLIGATRETTSTTLNQLERRGLVKLSRRLLTIPSPSTLLNAAAAKNNGVRATGVM